MTRGKHSKTMWFIQVVVLAMELDTSIIKSSLSIFLFQIIKYNKNLIFTIGSQNSLQTVVLIVLQNISAINTIILIRSRQSLLITKCDKRPCYRSKVQVVTGCRLIFVVMRFIIHLLIICYVGKQRTNYFQ